MITQPAIFGKEWRAKTCRWVQSHPGWTLTAVTLVLLGPFLAKPFNIDDPLFIWAARQIQAHPADPYGFHVEWGWTQFPMWKVTENPPLACYYLAVIASVAGWSELAVHTAFLAPVLAVVLGTHRLARHCCGHPIFATMAMLLTPVFLVSGLTVMCDMMMLAFWIWSVVFWLEGTAEEKSWKFLAAAGLMTLAALSKYYGACLILLLGAYGVAARRPVGRWGQFLLLPLAALLAYQLITRALYGNSLLYNAMAYASFSRKLFAFSAAQSGLTALVFTGGCVATAAIFAPLLWRARTLALLLGVSLVVAGVFFFGDADWKKYGLIEDGTRKAVEVQTVIWVAAALSLLTLAATDVWQRRNAQAWLLSLWLLGTFVFVALLNWTVNARSILPMTPAAGILIVRRLEAKGMFEKQGWIPRIALCLAGSLILAMAVLQADCMTAFAVRQNARDVCAAYLGRLDTMWFQGHWGFQYYMEQSGAKAVDFKHPGLKPGDGVAVPSNNTNIRGLDPRNSELADFRQASGPWFVSTTDQSAGASFYAAALGPLPFAFGRIRPETVSVYVLRPMTQTPSMPTASRVP